jgi:hypothetical protein
LAKDRTSEFANSKFASNAQKVPNLGSMFKVKPNEKEVLDISNDLWNDVG